MEKCDEKDQDVKEICKRFCEIIHFPPVVLESFQAKQVCLETISIIDRQVLEIMSQISENDIVDAFSQL